MANLKNSEINDLFLFRNIPIEKIEVLTKNVCFNVKHFSKDEPIYQPDSYVRSLGFIIRGSCCVNKKRHDGTLIPLNTLNKGDSFGAITLFSEEMDYPTYIYATKHTEVLFINKSDAVRLISENPQISINFIEFLTDRILFLNRKISTFSSGSAEQKLANYILTRQREIGECEFAFNKKLTSEALGIGRASLYRALISLERERLITTDNKKIYITDLTGLERITK